MLVKEKIPLLFNNEITKNKCMREIVRSLLLITTYLTIYTSVLFSQVKDIGIPFIVNYSRETYKASAQNWSVTQNDKGYLYFGNNDGILEYDGTAWKVYSLPNSLIVRSVYSDGDTIFAGAFEEIGFLAHQADSGMVYQTLNHLIPEEYSDFDEVWEIFQISEKIYFRSSKYIFVYDHKEIKVIEPVNSFQPMHFVNKSLYVVDTGRGLMVLREDSLQVLSEDPVFFRNEIRSILPFAEGEYLVGTSNEAVFVWDGENITPWETTVNDHLIEDKLYSAIRLNDGSFAWGSLSGGLYISNRQGEILQHLDRYKGLQNNTVLSLLEDKRNNLWIALDNGIDFIETSSPLSRLNFNYNLETPYTSIRHDGIFYVGTNQGLYAIEEKELQRPGKNPPQFRIVEGTEGQIWKLKVLDNTLLCGHNFGCFVIDGFISRKISDVRGFWDFIEIPGKSGVILAGTYSGLMTIEKQGNLWSRVTKVDGFSESSRVMFYDGRGFLWISHGYRGIFQLQLNESLDAVSDVRLFFKTGGLDGELPYNLQVLNGEMYVTARNGIFQFDYENDHFVAAKDKISNLFHDKELIDLIQPDQQGNFWYFTHDNMGVIRLLEDGSYRDISAPFAGISDALLPAFQNIYSEKDGNNWIGTWNGLVHYNSNLVKEFGYMEEVFVRELSFLGKQDTMTVYNINRDFNDQSHKISVPFRLNGVVFRFTLPSYENPQKIRFSQRLRGFSDQWSDWDLVNFKEFTNLREGDYIFEVKASYALGNESEIKSVPFTIEPPYYRSRTAWMVYSLLILVIIITNIYFVRRRILRIRQREKQKHDKKMAEKEKDFREKTAMSEQEIVQLKNQSLQSEMSHKNKELANTTLHLIQKNKTLTSLRADLSKLLKNSDSVQSQKYLLNNLIKKINRDLKNEKNWELFNSYFDEVHQDFIIRLKEDYKNLTPKELRLCAYLRMNLSTKEIAPLMNISIRGVEISRYRLRKKLELPHDTNLSDFIISY